MLYIRWCEIEKVYGMKDICSAVYMEALSWTSGKVLKGQD